MVFSFVDVFPGHHTIKIQYLAEFNGGGAVSVLKLYGLAPPINHVQQNASIRGICAFRHDPFQSHFARMSGYLLAVALKVL